jgi:outer membrane protein assembly factor BamA
MGIGVTVLPLVLVLLAQARAVEAPTISAVEVRLPAGADPKLLERVPALVTVRRGQGLSRRALARTIENLYATNRFADVTIEGAPDGAGGVALTIELVPRHTISEVYVEGGTSIPRADVLAASKLEVNAEYWPERLEQAARVVAEVYRRKGFRAVTVEPRADFTDTGLAIGFVVKEGPATRVASIAIVGEPGLPLSRLLDVLTVQVGEVLDEQRLEASVGQLRTLYRKERFYRARVESPVVAGDRVVMPVAAGAQYEIVFSGNRHFSAHSLKAVLGYDGDELLDSTLALRLAQRLERFYRFRGFHDVRVTPAEAARPERGRAALAFTIDEGAPLRVVDVAFSGNRAISPADLREVLLSVMESRAPPPSLEVRAESDPVQNEGRMGPVFAGELPAPPLDTVLDEGAWAEAAKAMSALYRERGYLKAAVTLDPIELARGQARTGFTVVEGPQALFHSIGVTGLPAAITSFAAESVPTGTPFSADALERVKQQVLHELGRGGYLFATAETAFTIDDSGHEADGLVVATAGPQVKVRAILPVGNVRTADEVLLAQATMVEGAPLDVDMLYRTQNNLMALGIFRTAEVELLSPERAEPLKTVLLKVRELGRAAVSGGGGYFVADGVRGVLDLNAPNLGGKAINLTAHGQVNLFGTSIPAETRQIDLSTLQPYETIGGRFNLSVTSRSLLPANIGTRIDVVAERVFRPQFRFTRAAAIPSIDWSTTFEVPRIAWLKPKFSVALQYEAEWSGVESTTATSVTALPTSLVDQQRLRFLFGTYALQTVRLSPTLDLRDNSLNPHKGLLLQASGEVTGAFYTEDLQHNHPVVNFLKASALATGYVPLGKAFVLAVSARAGRVFALSSGSITPPVHRFFMGGATSMRGFYEDAMIAEDLRKSYREEVQRCQVLVVKDGCSPAATVVANGGAIPSQGGELFALFKAEVRFPVYSFEVGVFAEAGNLLLSVRSPFSLRWVAGLGVRYNTPVGPLALDFGFNLSPDLVINEQVLAIQFNIGVF